MGGTTHVDKTMVQQAYICVKENNKYTLMELLFQQLLF